MNREIQQRLHWVTFYEESGDAGLVCRRCGISRPTLRKWWQRYQKDGVDGLQSHSRRPLNSPNAKVNDNHEHLILGLRSERNLGARRIQSELLRQQRIQTDRGLEFFATKVQEKLMEKGIKFRPNKPGSPHLNGKVERSQKTDKTEFYTTVDLADENLKPPC